MPDVIHFVMMVFMALPLPVRLMAIALIGFIFVRPFWPILGPRRQGRWRPRVSRRPFRHRVPSQESPIEEIFRLTWAQMYPQIPLVQEYPIGRYRVDFAHIASKIAIELDGFEAHSSTRSIEHDRQRQRELMRRGWQVFRFGGREVNRNPRACAQETYEFILQQQAHLQSMR